jgi:hypothetical protein
MSEHGIISLRLLAVLVREDQALALAQVQRLDRIANASPVRRLDQRRDPLPLSQAERQLAPAPKADGAASGEGEAATLHAVEE